MTEDGSDSRQADLRYESRSAALASLADAGIISHHPNMLIRATKIVNLLALGLSASAALCGQLPPIAFLSMGFREAKVADVTLGPGSSARRADPNGFLAVTADFNGDGKPDEARILLNEQRHAAYVVVVIQSSSKVDTYVLSQMSLQDASNIGIALAKPLGADQSRGLAGVTVFALDSGIGEANYFDGEDFNKRVAVASVAPRVE